jgi:hypothetical protein
MKFDEKQAVFLGNNIGFLSKWAFFLSKCHCPIGHLLPEGEGPLT